MIDAKNEHIEIIKSILQKHIPQCEIRVFGSRVTLTAKSYSDLDLAVMGKEKLPNEILYALKESFEESDLPFRVDVLDWNNISENFKKIIESKYEVLQNPQ
ncbi:MAG: nucleotidyltransferase domain-containing protein [Elusimicrobiota bacterium]|nr:nucleotidyltransferase domain-containing protein [Elusimicrobiota bacterium]